MEKRVRTVVGESRLHRCCNRVNTRLAGLVVRNCKDKYWQAAPVVPRTARQMMGSITLAVFARPDVSLIPKATSKNRRERLDIALSSAAVRRYGEQRRCDSGPRRWFFEVAQRLVNNGAARQWFKALAGSLTVRPVDLLTAWRNPCPRSDPAPRPRCRRCVTRHVDRPHRARLCRQHGFCCRAIRTGIPTLQLHSQRTSRVPTPS